MLTVPQGLDAEPNALGITSMDAHKAWNGCAPIVIRASSVMAMATDPFQALFASTYVISL